MWDSDFTGYQISSESGVPVKPQYNYLIVFIVENLLKTFHRIPIHKSTELMERMYFQLKNRLNCLISSGSEFQCCRPQTAIGLVAECLELKPQNNEVTTRSNRLLSLELCVLSLELCFVT